MFIMDDEQSDVVHGCTFSAVTSIHLSELRNTFVSSAEGVQREVGVSLPLGAVDTARI